MFKRCWDRQPDNIQANQDSDIWSWLIAEGLIARDPDIWVSRPVLAEDGSRYPGFYSLDEVIPGGMASQGP